MEKLPIEKIRRDGGTQMRDAISEVTAVTYAEHMQDGDEFPPVTVFFDGEVYWLADGFHRCAGYERAGIDMVPADIRSGQRIDAVRYALKANATNGRPRTTEDMRRAYRVAVDAGLCEATDSDGVKALLEVSKRWAMELTKAAKDKAKEERNKRVIELDEQGKTQDEIAAETRCGQKTVSRVLAQSKMHSSFLTEDEETESEPSLVDLEAKEAARKANSYKSTKKKEKKEQRQQAVQQKAQDVAPASERYEVHLKPCTALLQMPAESIDWVVTDPPYPKEFLDVYDDLAKAASHVLKPGGSLMCMIGQSYLPEIIAKLDAELDYHWTISYLTPGGQATQLFDRNVNTFWKPILWFTKGKYQGQWIGDTTRSNVNDNDKNHHHWGQSCSGMKDLMQRFVSPGDVVVDPFMGAGTTGVVSLDLGCYFIGHDIDEKSYNEALVRLSDASVE